LKKQNYCSNAFVFALSLMLLAQPSLICLLYNQVKLAQPNRFAVGLQQV
jgi:hypothetical protein